MGSPSTRAELTTCPACCGRERSADSFHDGMVEVVSSLERDGRPVFRDLRWGVYVVLKAPNSYAAACFTQYGLPTDSTGQYAAMYKPFHLIGLELSISVLNAALRGESTGTAREWRGDVVAVAKRTLTSSETLDGEGHADIADLELTMIGLPGVAGDGMPGKNAQ